MRTRLLQDILNLEGVDWVALVGPDALPIDFLPDGEDVDSAVAMWMNLDFLVDDMPAKMLVRTSDAIMLSHRVDEDRLLLIHVTLDVNIGLLRSTLEVAAQRVIDLA
jgi:predicted regulator of Ras-like GTPase activity (Roadblock/LC7/MglB family)